MLVDGGVRSRVQVLPHTECVEHNEVSVDGQSVKHVTKCTDEVTKLEVHYHSSTRSPFRLKKGACIGAALEREMGVRLSGGSKVAC